MAEAATSSPVPVHTKGRVTDESTTKQISDTFSVKINYSPAELTIFRKVIASDRTIQSQQRGEPELNDIQKMAYLCSLLKSRSGNFLMRFGSLLDDSDLTYIESVVKLDYEIQYRIREFRKQLGLSSKSRQKQVQNRRFQYLQQMMETTSYFSEEEMRNRNPLLYEEYIGQYLTKEEKDSLDMGDRGDVTLSGLILKKMEIDRRRDLYDQQEGLESSQVEESDSDDSEVESMDQSAQISDDQKLQLHTDFLRTMQLSFLNGEDVDFDYSSIDNCEDLDSLDMIGRDAEDAYFDDEEPTSLGDYESLCDDDRDS